MAQEHLFDVPPDVAEVHKSAEISECADGADDPEHDRDACLICDVYRYELRRVWGPGPLCVWIMLNPSTADARNDDATIRKCIRFAKKWGYGGIVVYNLYGLRATKPKVLWRHDDPVGPENDRYLARIDPKLMVVCAWGASGHRGDEVLEALRSRGIKPHYLELTAAGQPRHPLYLKETLAPRPLAATSGTTGQGGLT